MIKSKKTRTLTALIIFAVGLVSAAESKPEFEKLEQALRSSEAQHSDIVEGTEKWIRWYHKPPQKTPYTIVYLHGFSASRQELSPTTELLADRIGANVFYTRLHGHGRSDDAMAEATTDAWKHDALEALKIGSTIGDKIILVSASTGGTIATWSLATLAANTDKVIANLMVSPNYGIKNKSAGIVTWPGGLTIAKWLNGSHNSFTPVSAKHAQFWTERYPLDAVVPMLDLVDEVADLDKSAITSPQLLVFSPDDKVINVNKVIETSKEFESADVTLERFTLSNDHVQHVLSGDACSPNSTQAMVDLMASYLESLGIRK